MDASTKATGTKTLVPGKFASSTKTLTKVTGETVSRKAKVVKRPRPEMSTSVRSRTTSVTVKEPTERLPVTVTLEISATENMMAKARCCGRMERVTKEAGLMAGSMGKEPTSGSMARSTLVNISMKSRKDMESSTGLTRKSTKEPGKVASNTDLEPSLILPVKPRTENGIWASSRDG